jgi:ligand-binding SRPBCC domain-containing protein
MKYLHRFQVRAPLARVSEFHSRAASMAAITPPPIFVRMKHSPEILSEGDVMDFTMWIGPFPIQWQARIEAVSPVGFTDRQLRGPFAAWVHRHSFTAVDEQITQVVDEVSLRLRSHPVWWLVGMGMRAGLPILFAYRGWKTRRILQ